LRKVKTAPGTTSSRSIVESGGYVYWYHPSGIYRTQGASEQIISNSIEDVIDGVNDNNQGNVCGWRNEIENTINFYLGEVTLRTGETINHCIVSFDENSETTTVRSFETVIKVATNWLESNIPKVYAGDTTSTVYQLDTGTNYNDNPISFSVELNPVFPAGSEALVNFRRLRAYIDNGPDAQIYYKLIYKPTKNPNVWVNDENWKPMRGSQIGERAEWYFPTDARASGVILKIVESSKDESLLIKKLVLYYSGEGNR
jgi:hypothetical protein